MKTQIYLNTLEDALACVEAGADWIGHVVDEYGRMPGKGSDYANARVLFAAIRDRAVGVALTVAPTVEEIIELIDAVRPDVVQISSQLDRLSAEDLGRLKAARPTTKLMRSIPMNGPDPIGAARDLERACDLFILDTNDPSAVDIGATGLRHDWALSAELVRRVNVPVILAGGLSPENVADAIRAVRPWGVDSFTHTNLGGQPGRKDPERVRAFVRATLDTA